MLTDCPRSSPITAILSAAPPLILFRLGKQSWVYITSKHELGTMTRVPLQQNQARGVWVGRIVWAIIALVGVGLLAKATPGASLDVTGAPLLSVAVVGGLVLLYPRITKLIGGSD